GGVRRLFRHARRRAGNAQPAAHFESRTRELALRPFLLSWRRVRDQRGRIRVYARRMARLRHARCRRPARALRNRAVRERQSAPLRLKRKPPWVVERPGRAQDAFHELKRCQTCREAVMVQLPIKRTIERIPGGMMIVPLFTGAIIRTLAPGTPQFFGSFTGAPLPRSLTILAAFSPRMAPPLQLKAPP